MSEIIEKLIQYFALIIDVIGVVIVMWGVGRAVITLIVKEVSSDKRESKREHFQKMRYDLGYVLVLAIEFFLAGDIIRTVISPEWNDLARVAALAVIRTILSFVLTKEMKMK
jgi:uncharacterized membrane protein